MKIVIATQVAENYSEDSHRPYWKYKGGNIYEVKGLTPNEVVAMGTELPRDLVEIIEMDGSMFVEYIRGWSFEDDDVDLCDEWESPIELSYENGSWRAHQIREGYGFRPEILKEESWWTCGKGQSHEDYEVVYHMVDGSKLNYKELEEYFNA